MTSEQPRRSVFPSSDPAEVFPARPGRSFWLDAAGAGLIAGALFGLWFQYTMGAMSALGTIFRLGAPAPSFAWIVHLVHSALFGVLYAVLVDSEALRPYAAHPLYGVAVGAVYGAVLWFLLNVVFWPFWAVGVAGLSGVSTTSIKPVAGHLLWGILVGGLFPQLRRL